MKNSVLTRLIPVVVFFGLLISQGQVMAAWNPDKVGSVKACQKCHEKQVEVWKKTKHYLTFKGAKPLSKRDKAKEIAEKMGLNPKRIKKAELCAGCHFTLMNKGGKVKAVSGVSCESCHGPSADWLKIHNEFGGKGVKIDFEAPEHRASRHKKMDAAGMSYPGNIYGFAKNCYQCHIVGNQDLVNKGGHKAGSEFDFVKRTQGKIRHGKPASGPDKGKMQVLGYAVELELSLKALAKAGSGKYATAMANRAATALANLKDISKRVGKAPIKAMVAAGSVKLSPGSGALKGAANKIAAAARQFSASGNQGLAALNGRRHIKANASMSASAPSPAQEPTPKPKKTETVAIKPKADPKPDPKPDTKPKRDKKPKVDTKITRPKQPVVKPDTEVALVTPPASGGGKLIRSFEIIKPSSNKLCNTNRPYLVGEKVVTSNMKLNSKDCFTLKFVAGRGSNVYLFSQTHDGKAIKLLPNSCNAVGINSHRIGRNRSVYAPTQQGVPGTFTLDDKPGVEWYYAVAVDNSGSEQELQSKTASFTDVCQLADAKPGTMSAEQFQGILKSLKQNSNGNLQWEVRRFQHN